jgi:hypothetical protein
MGNGVSAVLLSQSLRSESPARSTQTFGKTAFLDRQAHFLSIKLIHLLAHPHVFISHVFQSFSPQKSPQLTLFISNFCAISQAQRQEVPLKCCKKSILFRITAGVGDFTMRSPLC